MRELTFSEVESVSGGLDGCTVPSLGDVGGAAGGAGAIGTAGGAMSGSSAIATGWGIIAAAVTVAFLGGYTIGVGINHVTGQCDGK